MPKIEARGATLHYELWGEEGEVIALLNGIAMSVGNWRPVADLLTAAGYRVLCHDFRGQMLSQRGSGPYSLRGHAEDFASLLGKLGLDRAHVMGTSYGGEVGLEFALAFPGRAASLAIFDSVAATDPLLTAAVEGWKACALADPRAFYRSIIAWNYSSEYIGAHRDELLKREDAIASLPRVWFEDFAALCDAFLAIDLEPRIGAIAVPTLVAWAEADILKGERYSRAVAERIPGALARSIPGSGHAVAMERPEAVARTMLDFLEGLRG